MKSQTTNPDEPLNSNKLLRPDDVAHVLDISVSQVYRMLNNGAIPTVRFGSSVRVRACDLETFIQRSWSGWRQD